MSARGKAVARLRICAGSPEPSLLVKAISTKTLCADLYHHADQTEVLRLALMSQCMRFQTMWYVQPAKP